MFTSLLRRGITRPKQLASLSLLALFMLGAVAHAQGTLKVMRQGLGTGTIQATAGSTINCGTQCDQTFPAATSVTLQANAAAGSAFDGWSGDCAGSAGNVCTFSMTGDRAARARFRLNPDVPTITAILTPEAIRDYLIDNPSVDTAAEFLRALPDDFRKGWILMTRSESLQTGTAKFPRILLPSADARYVFTLGLAEHASYPGSHPNAIEFMQWDGADTQKTFRFHEIVLAPIPAMGRPELMVKPFPARARGISIDEQRCTRCHSTRNIRNPDGADAGTTGFPEGIVPAKNKPNWDTYDSWGGMLPFNRDKVFQGSVEAAALRKLLNPWTWRADEPSRRIMEQLALQSNEPGTTPTYLPEDVFRRLEGGTNDGHLQFAFDNGVVLIEPAPIGASVGPINYKFDNVPGAPPGSNILRDDTHVRLQAVATPTNGAGEGRGVQLFDQLGGGDGGGNFNQIRVGNELANHRFATGSVPLDARPLALAINTNCYVADAAGNINPMNGAPAFTGDRNFFDGRNGMTLAEVVADTDTRAKDIPRRKADIEKLNLDRNGDVYLFNTNPPSPDIDLISQYGAFTSFDIATGLERLRQEVFRRAPVPGVFPPDQSIMGGGHYVDREIYPTNTLSVALFRYLLEPLGVPVDKWSINVRGRSRSYTFADVFGSYPGPIGSELRASLMASPFPGLTNLTDCASLGAAANTSLSALPGVLDVPRYTDVQRIFNKSCIECHGGLDYPPFANYSSDPASFDLSEREDPPDNNRLTGSYETLVPNYVAMTAAESYLFQRIDDHSPTGDNCPFGAMPCGGPRLSQVDVETIRRWINGGSPNTAGDPHIVTVDNVAYDFQSAGEFTLLRGEGMELQARQTAVATDGPLPPNPYTGLTSCASINTAAAMKVGTHRVTYEPDVTGAPSPEGLTLRIDGYVVPYPGAAGIDLEGGGRILPTTAAGGLQIQMPAGTEVIVTPGFWDYYQVWYLNIDVRAARAVFGVMGAVAPDNWLPALANGVSLGPIPPDLATRYHQLYVKFADSWRVTKHSSLFDYAPGVTTDKYTLKSWPGFQPTSCQLPRHLQVKPRPPKKIPADKARNACADLDDANRRQNCERDVAITGDFKFANTYEATEKLERNDRPKRVALKKPEAFAINLDQTVTFRWNKTFDRDRGRLTYKHCLWKQGEKLTTQQCTLLPGTPESTTVSGLNAGKFYLWKVVVDDGQGATVTSETRKFQVAQQEQPPVP